MLQAAIAIDGVVTEVELKAFMSTAIKMGEITQEAGMAAIKAYQASVNSTILTLKVIAQIEDSAVRDYEPPDKYGLIFYRPSQANNGVRSFNEASGGAIHAASGISAYTVGEIGPEPFFPATNGRILSNSEAKSQLRSAWSQGGGESIVVNINTPINLADRVWVERELEPYIRKALRQAR
jgi:hypothetical protein